MAFVENFDSIKEKAAEVAISAAKKTKQLAEISKANIAIYSLEDKIKKAEIELGKLYYRDYAVEEERDMAEYLPWCKRIDDAKRAIADLRDHIENLKNGKAVEADADIQVIDEDDFQEVHDEA